MNWTQGGFNVSNTTWAPLPDSSIFLDYEKALIGLVPVLVLVVGILMYKYVRKPSTGQDDTSAKRLLPFYTLSAGIMWGQVFMHAFPNAATHGDLGYWFRSLFFMVGYCCMVGYERLSRTQHQNRHFVGQSSSSRTTHFTVRQDQDLEADYVVMDGDSSGANLWDASEEMVTIRRRRVTAHIYYLMITFHCLMDGLFLAYNGRATTHILLVLFFALQKCLESVALFTVLIHARMYTTRGAQKRWFFVLLLGWPLVVLCSTIIPLAEVGAETAAQWIDHVALGIFYSLFVGVLLWFANHFEHIEPEHPTKKQLRVSYFFFVATAATMWLTGVFI